MVPVSDAKSKAVQGCAYAQRCNACAGGVLINCRVFNSQGAREHQAPAYWKQEGKIK